jgi:exopolyphosphatase/guanosine-5'-triphosphate,3'-diphosphate pyrophosphatase
LLVLAHRGQLRKLAGQPATDEDWPLIAALRLAALFARSRSDSQWPELVLKERGRRFNLGVPADWLAKNPLTETALREEMKQWRAAGGELEIRLTGMTAEAGAALSAA